MKLRQDSADRWAGSGCMARLVRCSSFCEKLTHFKRVAFALDLVHPRLMSPRQGLHSGKECGTLETLFAILLIHGLEGVPDQAAKCLVTQKLNVSVLERRKKSVAAVVGILKLYLDDVRNLGINKIILTPVAVAAV